jgi:hypothetical protein
MRSGVGLNAEERRAGLLRKMRMALEQQPVRVLRLRGCGVPDDRDRTVGARVTHPHPLRAHRPIVLGFIGALECWVEAADHVQQRVAQEQARAPGCGNVGEAWDAREVHARAGVAHEGRDRSDPVRAVEHLEHLLQAALAQQDVVEQKHVARAQEESEVPGCDASALGLSAEHDQLRMLVLQLAEERRIRRRIADRGDPAERRATSSVHSIETSAGIVAGGDDDVRLQGSSLRKRRRNWTAARTPAWGRGSAFLTPLLSRSTAQ